MRKRTEEYGHAQINLFQKVHFLHAPLCGGSISGTHPDLIEKSLLKHHLEPTSTATDVCTGSWRKPCWPPVKAEWQTMQFDNLTRNHSIAGALNLLCIGQEIIDHWPDVDPRLVLVFELAAEAIFLHDLTGKDSFSKSDLTITFQQSPLAVVLILADEMQCWGRPVLRHRPGGDDSETITRFCSEHDELQYELMSEDEKPTLFLEGHVFDKLDKMHGKGRLEWNGLLEIKRLGRGRPSTGDPP